MSARIEPMLIVECLGQDKNLMVGYLHRIVKWPG